MAQCSTIVIPLCNWFEIIFGETMKQSDAITKLVNEINRYERDGNVVAAELRRLHELNQVMLNALKWIADQTYDPWTNGAEAQRHALNAIAKATTE